MAVSTMVGTAKKNMHFGIFVSAEAQEIKLQGNFQGSKCDGDLYSYENFFFLFYEKIPSLLEPVGFFSKYF